MHRTFKDARVRAAQLLDEGNHEAALSCITQHVTPEMLRDHIDACLALVQVMSLCIPERARRFIEQLPEDYPTLI